MLRKCLLIFFLAFGLTGSIAHADTNDDRHSTYEWLTTDACTSGQLVDQDGNILDLDGKPLLPVQRWIDATERRHTRLDVDAWADLAEKGTNNLSTMAMSFGNFTHSTIADLADFVTRAKLVCALGPTSDKLGATFGDTLMGQNGASSQLLAIIVVGVILSSIWQAARHARKFGSTNRSVLGDIAKLIGVLGFASIMLVGAHRSNEEKGTFGVMSPGWMVDRVNTVTADIGASVSATAVGLFSDADQTPGSDAGPEPSCAGYRDWLISQYEAGVSQTGLGLRPATAVMFNAMWERTGLETWKTLQFSDADNGRLADRVYCRLLEMFSYVDPQTQQRITNSYSPFEFHENAFSFTDGAVSRDLQMMAWAICVLDSPDGSAWKVDEVFEDPDNPGRMPFDGDYYGTGGNCNDLFVDGDLEEGRGGNGLGDNTNFDFDGGLASRFPNSPEAVEFIDSLHGYNKADGLMQSAMYGFSSVVLFVMLGGLLLAVLFAQLVISVGISLIIPVAILDVLPRQEGEPLRVVTFARKLFGAMLVSSFYLFVLAIIVTFARVITEVAVVLTGAGSSLANLASSLSTAAAAYMLHRVSKKSGLGSIFTPSGAMALGKGFSNAPGRMASSFGVGKATAAVAGGTFIGSTLANKAKAANQRRRTANRVSKNLPKSMQPAKDGSLDDRQKGKLSNSDDLDLLDERGEALGMKAPEQTAKGKHIGGKWEARKQRVLARGARSGIRTVAGGAVMAAGVALTGGALLLPAAAGLVAAKAAHLPANRVQRRIRRRYMERVKADRTNFERYNRQVQFVDDQLALDEVRRRKTDSGGGGGADTNAENSE